MKFDIAGRKIGPGHPTYIIAEVSANHQQDYRQARRIVDAAARAGADAVKLQTYTADTITIQSNAKPFRVGKGSLWEGRTLYDLYEEAYTPWEWQPKLKRHAESKGMHCFSSPFDPTAIDFLESIDVPAYKVASFEIVDLPLVERMAATRKPMIISTGMASLAEIHAAVRTAWQGGARGVALLKCTSAYPAPPEEMDLRTIPHMREAFHVPVGLSDHTLGLHVPVAAVALGATLLEKHITLNRTDGGPDSAFSTEPDEFAALVKAVRETEKALGEVKYGLHPRERSNAGFRRSLYAVADIAVGEALTEANIRSIRPGGGLPPAEIKSVLGRSAARAIPRGTPLSWDLVGAPLRR